DSDTAQISVNAALTGHLLFSTIHANDSEGTIPRLLNNNVDPFLVASTIELIVAQRLVRTICPNCKTAYTLSYEKLTEKLGYESPIFKGEKVTLYKGKGCNSCENTGYKGRTGIFEMIEITPAMKELIMENPSAGQIGELARKKGFQIMFEHGMEKVKIGETTLEEVLRVAPTPIEKGYDV
ncbi:MAG: GspE/PulE family protein, partial [Candidatus Paceibacteria bacterium]